MFNYDRADFFANGLTHPVLLRALGNELRAMDTVFRTLRWRYSLLARNISPLIIQFAKLFSLQIFNYSNHHQGLHSHEKRPLKMSKWQALDLRADLCLSISAETDFQETVVDGSETDFQHSLRLLGGQISPLCSTPEPWTSSQCYLIRVLHQSCILAWGAFHLMNPLQSRTKVGWLRFDNDGGDISYGGQGGSQEVEIRANQGSITGDQGKPLLVTQRK